MSNSVSMSSENKTQNSLVLLLDKAGGLKEYYTDSNGVVENSRCFRESEKILKHSARRISRKVKGSKNKGKARQILGLRHLKISKQPYCTMLCNTARFVISPNYIVALVDLKIKNMVKNHCLAKSINDVYWYHFCVELEFFGKIFEKITVAVNPQ